LGDFCLAPPKAGLGFGNDFEGIFEVAKQFLPAQTEVRTDYCFFAQKLSVCLSKAVFD
jgi:hypothetical protein